MKSFRTERSESDSPGIPLVQFQTGLLAKWVRMRPTITATTLAFAEAMTDLAFPRPGEIAQRMLTQIVLGRRCQRALLAELTALGLTDTQLMVLWGIDRLSPSQGGTGVQQSEVAQSLGISPAQISGLVEQLRQQGNLDSRRAVHDRRQQLWHLTEPGRAKLTEALVCVSHLDLEFITNAGFPFPFPASSSSQQDKATLPETAPTNQQGEAA